MARPVVVTLNTDGGVRTGGRKGPDGGKTGVAAISAVIKDEDGNKLFADGMVLKDRATVNEAEYSAIIYGLFHASELGATVVNIKTDSQLVANQILGNWMVKQEHLKDYYDEVQDMLKLFDKVSVEWVPREQNQHADMIARVILDEEVGA